MAAGEDKRKIMEELNKYDQFIGCSIEYRNDLPESMPGVKFLPSGAKTLMDYTTDPVSFPEQETQYEFDLKGLYQVLDLDLNAQNPHEYPTQRGKVDARDAVLLTDIVDPNMPIPPPISAQQTAKQRRTAAPRTHASVLPFGVMQLHQSEKQEIGMDAVSVEQQKLAINRTFVDVNKPLYEHPFKPNSGVHPVAVMPLLPEQREAHEFVHVKFGIPPNIKEKSLLKNCGNHLINFKEISDQPTETINRGITSYISDQRFREDHNSEAERFEHLVLHERHGHVFYQIVSNQLRLRKERPTANTRHGLCLLQMKCKKPATG
ncbi:uncharacterized protein LOC127565139 [Drosophila albomicans]|uniref:Uncharacterized protein LOC127565139 n=1 Tax=Drosophila albomicans TaxID=7291 RepID=A0A9C6SYR6_DROAB|nr:uncharacterized protein LOC127565139 [Drosophila albomicans]